MPPVQLRRSSRHLVVCGDNPLAHRLVEELTTLYAEEVTVILPSKRRNHGPEISRLPGVRVIEADRLDDEAFRSARVASARALALVDQDDVGNIHAALRAHEVNPEVRLVLRMFNVHLGRRVRDLFPGSAVLSDADIAAPEFVATSLGMVAPSHIRLPGRTLHVARRGQVVNRNIVCTVAADPAAETGPRLLPEEETPENGSTGAAPAQSGSGSGPAGNGRSGGNGATTGAGGAPAGHRAAEVAAEDLVLAIADGTGRGSKRRFPWRRRRQMFWESLRAMVNRKLRMAALILLAVLVVGTVLDATLGRNTWAEALYITLLTAAGAGNLNVDLSFAEKLIQVVLTLAGVAVVPVLTAAVVDSVVGARLALQAGRLQGTISGHVVVVGLGNVGTRVIQQMRDLDVPVVCVERNELAMGVAVARRLGIPIVFGDATRQETLQAAQVATCRALVAVASDDVTNLEAGLYARASQPHLQVVLRLFDGDLAARVQRRFDIPISRSVAYIAASAFAVAMVNREVIGSIPVGRRLLLVAEVPLAQGAALVGEPVAVAHRSGESRVIGLAAPNKRTEWTPAPDRRLEAGERLIVIATKSGVSRLLTRSVPPADSPARGDRLQPSSG